MHWGWNRNSYTWREFPPFDLTVRLSCQYSCYILQASQLYHPEEYRLYITSNFHVLVKASNIGSTLKEYKKANRCQFASLTKVLCKLENVDHPPLSLEHPRYTTKPCRFPRHFLKGCGIQLNGHCVMPKVDVVMLIWRDNVGILAILASTIVPTHTCVERSDTHGNNSFSKWTDYGVDFGIGNNGKRCNTIQCLWQLSPAAGVEDTGLIWSMKGNAMYLECTIEHVRTAPLDKDASPVPPRCTFIAGGLTRARSYSARVNPAVKAAHSRLSSTTAISSYFFVQPTSVTYAGYIVRLPIMQLQYKDRTKSRSYIQGRGCRSAWGFKHPEKVRLAPPDKSIPARPQANSKLRKKCILLSKGNQIQMR